jgi:hypothetical protein
MSAPKIAEPELQLVREKEKGVVEEIDISKKITLQGFSIVISVFRTT